MKKLSALILLLLICIRLEACNNKPVKDRISESPLRSRARLDTTSKDNIRFFFKDAKNLAQLNFPKISFRHYKKYNFRYTWLDGSQSKAFAAVKMLKSAAEFGLNAKSFHLEDNSFLAVEKLLKSEDDTPLKGRTDILLTDAILTFVIQLHFGMANPYISYKKMDSDSLSSFQADLILAKALENNFEESIFNVQPQDSDYKNLLTFMKQSIAKYSKGYFEKAEDTLRLVAINLERYRWTNVAESTYVAINIPSFYLKVRQAENADSFKVIVGKPSSPTPVLKSSIGYFNIAPDWNVPSGIFRRELLPKMLRDPSYVKRNNFAIYSLRGEYIEPTYRNIAMISNNPSAYYIRQSYGCDNALGQIVFHFENPYNVYLHDTPERKLFNTSFRALSHGCIRVQDPQKLVSVLLSATNAPEKILPQALDAMEQYRKFRYTFPQPVPIVIRYITCAVQDGQLKVFKDVYNRDKQLVDQLFSSVKFLPD